MCRFKRQKCGDNLLALSKPPPKLLLFLSADVHNSTAFKNDLRHDGSVQGWLATFKTFYSRFPIFLARKCTSRRVVAPVLWKLLGDELIFAVELKKSEEAVSYVQSLREAITQYNADWKRKNVELALKGTAWVAHFPVFNAEIQIKEPNDANKFRVDYIGPAMDIGFRLARLASKRKLIVSVDLALMLLHTNNDLRVFFDGRETLKGALHNKPYPVIWVDVLVEGKGSPEDELRGIHPSQNKLKKYCEAFIAEMNEVMSRPFIDGDYAFNKKPDDWNKKYERACRTMNEEEAEPTFHPSQKSNPKSSEKATAEKFFQQAAQQFLDDLKSNKGK